MAEGSILVDQDQFTCSICLDLLNEPGTIPCGHSFCVACINGFWDQSKEKEVYSCPQCREAFTLRPVLRRNNVMSEVVDKLRKTTTNMSSSPVLDPVAPEVKDVDCDFCMEEKNKAVKSCLTCLASFCEAHIQPHYKSSAFQKHKVVTALHNLQERICAQHDKLLEVFCRTDQRGICHECLRSEHKDHETVLAEDEWMNKKTLINNLQKKSEEKLKTTEEGIKALTRGIESFKSSAKAARQSNERICDEMIDYIKNMCHQVNSRITAQEKVELDRSAELLLQLEQEISDLHQKSAELELLLLREDHINFVQAFQSFSDFVESTETLGGSVNTQFSFDDTQGTLSGLKRFLEKNIPLQLISDCLSYSEVVSPPQPKTRKDFLKYFHPALLDPNTAHVRLYLSEENTKAERKVQAQTPPELPERFDFYKQVLCQESLSRRFYFEVEWNGKKVTVGVSYKGIERKGNFNSRLGYNNQSWGLCCSPSDSSYIHDNKSVRVCITNSNRIGVYVDHRAGTLSFLNVSDTVTPIHTFQTTFSEPLYPCFWVGESSMIKLCGPK